jgi:hypothetical protein
MIMFDYLGIEICYRLTDEQLCKMLDESDFSKRNILTLYEIAQKNNRIKLWKHLLQNPVILERFSFLGDLKEVFVSGNNLSAMPLPNISTEKMNFTQVVESILGLDYHKYYEDEFYKLTEQYGLIVLNNFLVFRSIFQRKKFKFKDFVNLDHGKSYDLSDNYESIVLKKIFQKYSLGRVAKLISSYEKEVAIQVSNFFFEIPKEVKLNLLDNLPKKPKTLTDVLSFFERKYTQLIPPDRTLNQAILKFDGKKIDNFSIFIPKTAGDLNQLGIELSNCLGKYPTRILSGSCEVLILKENDISKFAIELRKENMWYEITQMKGANNTQVINQKLQNKLIRLINEIPVRKIKSCKVDISETIKEIQL